MSPDFAIGSYCSSRSWGGLEMNVLRFLSWMRQRGWETFVYAHPKSRILARAAEFGVPAREVASTFRYGDLKNARRMAKLIRQDNVRVLSLHQSPDMLVGILAKRLSKRYFKLIYSQHMHIGADKKDFFHRWEYRQFDAWITPVQWLADRVLEKTVVPREKIHIIPRGIVLDRFQAEKPDKGEARGRLGLSEQATIVGIIGRLDRKKCQDTLVRAAKRVRDKGHDIHLAIIGDITRNESTGYAGFLRQLVADLDLTDRVTFCPHQREAQYAYAALDIFVLASESETAGMVVLEAFASGLPVIGTAAGGTLSQIQPGENGLLYPPHDDAALADCIERLLTDLDFARRLSDRARQDAINKYSHQKQCEGWERVIGELRADNSH
jgi:glycosyltransferase involved in cell wall biosynthesis